MVQLYFDGQTGGGQLLYGVTDRFKIAPTISCFRKRSKSLVLHLGPAKPLLTSLRANFILLTASPVTGVGEWVYQSPDNYLTLENLDEIVSVTAVDPTNYAIPIGTGEKADLVISSLHAQPVPL